MNQNKIALICGVGGQDGSYLAKLLLSKGYQVWGTSRDAQGNQFINHKKLGIDGKIKIISMIPEDFRSVFMAITKSNPNEIYNLTGQSSVALSFDQPAETIQSILLGILNLLEVCKIFNSSIRLYNAGSSECFGNTNGTFADEQTPFSPKSPYAVAKSSAFWLVKNYREAYGLYSCTGILFNHESCLRPERFVTQKIISAARRISTGSREKLYLGRLDISRDWGWAPEYVDAMWRMLQCDSPCDFVIATGETNSLKDFVSTTFEMFHLEWSDHVVQNEEFLRPADISMSRANPEKAHKYLGWSAQFKMRQVVASMVNELL